MKMSSSLSKIFGTGINVFKSNFQIIKNLKYYEISTINECVEKNDDKKITSSKNNDYDIICVCFSVSDSMFSLLYV